MSEHDVDRAAIQASSSSESSISIDSDPERRPLLLPENDPKASNYKSTLNQTDIEPNTEETGSLEEEPKAVFAVISLLLIGKSYFHLRECKPL
jgi:hypothetical protein